MLGIAVMLFHVKVEITIMQALSVCCNFMNRETRLVLDTRWQLRIKNGLCYEKQKHSQNLTPVQRKLFDLFLGVS